jgi:hypothetical protein
MHEIVIIGRRWSARFNLSTEEAPQALRALQKKAGL